MASFSEAQDKVLAFRDARVWKQFHNPKDLAISINLEASELLEVFQWSGADLNANGKEQQLKDELSDVLIYCIYLADAMGIDIPDAIIEKVEKNDRRYPVEKARGNSRKYTEL